MNEPLRDSLPLHEITVTVRMNPTLEERMDTYIQAYKYASWEANSARRITEMARAMGTTALPSLVRGAEGLLMEKYDCHYPQVMTHEEQTGDLDTLRITQQRLLSNAQAIFDVEPTSQYYNIQRHNMLGEKTGDTISIEDQLEIFMAAELLDAYIDIRNYTALIERVFANAPVQELSRSNGWNAYFHEVREKLEQVVSIANFSAEISRVKAEEMGELPIPVLEDSSEREPLDGVEDEAVRELLNCVFVAREQWGLQEWNLDEIAWSANEATLQDVTRFGFVQKTQNEIERFLRMKAKKLGIEYPEELLK